MPQAMRLALAGLDHDLDGLLKDTRAGIARRTERPGGACEDRRRRHQGAVHLLHRRIAVLRRLQRDDAALPRRGWSGVSAAASQWQRHSFVLFDPALAWASLPRHVHGLLNTVVADRADAGVRLGAGDPGHPGAHVGAPVVQPARSGLRDVLPRRAALILLYLVYYGLAQLPVVHEGPLWLIFVNAVRLRDDRPDAEPCELSWWRSCAAGWMPCLPALTEASAALGISPRQTFTGSAFRWRCATRSRPIRTRS